MLTVDFQYLILKNECIFFIYILESSSGPCHKDLGDPVPFTEFSVVDYPIP